MKYNQVEPYINKDDAKNVSKYLSSGGWVTEHRVTKDLEEKIKSFVGRKYCLSVPNGTIAIYLSLLAAGIGKGKRVAIPNLTMIATINAAIWANAEPVLVDVDEELCMSYDKLLNKKNIDAVIFVPLNGRTGDGKKIYNWCKKNKVKFIEDSAHALGSSYGNLMCGSMGDLSIFSFTPHKLITMGQGGMILTNNKKYFDYLSDLKYFNRLKDKNDWHKGFGLNFKITDLQASLGLSQFNKIESFIKNKKNVLREYEETINNPNVSFPGFKDYELPWFFDLKINTIKNKKILIEKLNSKGIETREFYPALSLQKYLNKYRNNDLKYSESIFKKILWLPSSNNLTKKDASYISSVVNSSTSKKI